MYVPDILTIYLLCRSESSTRSVSISRDHDLSAMILKLKKEIADERQNNMSLQEVINDLQAKLITTEKENKNLLSVTRDKDAQLEVKDSKVLSLESELRACEERNLLSLHENTKLMKLTNELNAREVELRGKYDELCHQCDAYKLEIVSYNSNHSDKSITSSVDSLRESNAGLMKKIDSYERALRLEQAEKNILVETLLNVRRKRSSVSSSQYHRDGSMTSGNRDSSNEGGGGSLLEVSVSALTSYNLSDLCTSTTTEDDHTHHSNSYNDVTQPDTDNYYNSSVMSVSELFVKDGNNTANHRQHASNSQLPSQDNGLNVNITSVVMKKVTAECAASFARCEMKLEHEKNGYYHQIEQQQQMIQALQEALSERENITEHIGKIHVYFIFMVMAY